MASKRRLAGFTLVEVCIAMTIVAATVAVVVRLHSAAVRSADRARGITLASVVAREKMEEAWLSGGDGSREGSGEELLDGSRFRWHREVSEVRLPSGGETGLQKIEVSVQHPAGATGGEYKLVTYRLVKPVPAGGLGGMIPFPRKAE